jgi:hypothetical protein
MGKGPLRGGEQLQGSSDCKTAKNSCKGQNSCKGEGFKEMSKEECEKAKAEMSKIASVSAISPQKYDSLSRPRQLVFVISAYNAYTVELI